MGALVFYTLCIVPKWEVVQAATIILAWQDNSTDEMGFKIERLSGAGYVEIAIVPANVVTYSDVNLLPGTPAMQLTRQHPQQRPSPSPSPPIDNPPPSSTPTQPPTDANEHGWSDYHVSLKMRSTDDDSLGVMFRFQDAKIIIASLGMRSLIAVDWKSASMAYSPCYRER